MYVIILIQAHLIVQIAWNTSAAATQQCSVIADNEQITLDLFVQARKKASLSLANVAWYVLHACSAESRASQCSQLKYLLGSLHCISISAN